MTKTLEELRRQQKAIAWILTHEFPEQEVPLESPHGYVIEVDGEQRRFEMIDGFNPSLKTPDYDTTKQRKKRQRYFRLQHVLTAYANAKNAISVYEKLTGENPDLAEDIECLAWSCFNHTEQYANLTQWNMQQGKESARQRGNRKGSGDLTAEQWQEVVARVDELNGKHGNRSKAARQVVGEISTGEFGKVDAVPGVDAVRKKRLE